jgi:hypothetical protein
MVMASRSGKQWAVPLTCGRASGALGINRALRSAARRPTALWKFFPSCVLRHDFAALGRVAPCGLNAQVMPCYVSFPYKITMLSARFCAAPPVAGVLLQPTDSN